MNLQPQELELVSELPPDLRVSLTTEFPDFEEVILRRKKLLQHVEEFDPVESVDDTPRMQEANRLRLDLVKCRTALDRIRKGAGESARKRVNAINEMFREWIETNESAEEFLKAQAEFAIRAEASRKAEIRQERLLAWSVEGFLEELLNGVDVAGLTEAQWSVFWRTGAEDKKARQEFDAEQKRQAEADRMERERLAAENDKLRREQEKERRKAEAKLAEERKQREALEQQERERVATEARKAEEERKAAAKAKRAPDKVKLRDRIDALAAMVQESITLKSQEASDIYGQLSGKIMAAITAASKEVERL